MGFSHCAEWGPRSQLHLFYFPHTSILISFLFVGEGIRKVDPKSFYFCFPPQSVSEAEREKSRISPHHALNIPQLHPSEFPSQVKATTLQTQQRHLGAPSCLLYVRKRSRRQGQAGPLPSQCLLSEKKPRLILYRHGSSLFRPAGEMGRTRERVFVKRKTKQAQGSVLFSADSSIRGIRPGLHFLDDLEPHIVSHMTPRPARQLHDPAEEVQRPSGDWTPDSGGILTRWKYCI